MANKDDEEPLPPSTPRQPPPIWVPEPMWQPSPQRNNALLDLQPPWVPPPPESAPPADQGDDVDARFQELLRLQAEQNSAIDRLRVAVKASTGREFGIGHNQGPPLSIDELDAESKRLLALLKDKGPRPTPADRVVILEQAKRTQGFSERILAWLKFIGYGVATIGVHEVTKNLTAPLWADVAHRIHDAYQALEGWLSSLAPLL